MTLRGSTKTRLAIFCGLDEAVRRANYTCSHSRQSLCKTGCLTATMQATIAHATTLLDAGVVKPVVSEGAVLLKNAVYAFNGSPTSGFVLWECPAAIAVIEAALVKARAGL